MSSGIENEPQNNEVSLDSSISSWDKYIGLEDILNNYDTVIEIFEDERAIYPDSDSLDWSETEYVALNENSVLPGWDYDEPSSGIQQIRDKLEGRSVILAFGFEGDELPNYTELNNGLESEGNWWDHPNSLNADLIVDKETYTGALKPPEKGEIRPHVFKENGFIRDVLHISD